MGQAAGTKRRKRRTGKYNIIKNRKAQYRKDIKLKKGGMQFLGLEDIDGAQCVMTRIEEGGLVANLKKFSKIDPKMFIRKAQNNQMKKVDNLIKRGEVDLANNMETRRKEQKDAQYAKRDVALSGPTVRLLSYYLDKYGEDYKAMVHDPRNYDQLTQKQLSRKIQSFKSTRQFVEYLRDRGLIPLAATSTSKSVVAKSSSSKIASETEEADDDDVSEPSDMDNEDNSSDDEQQDAEEQQRQKLREKISAMEKASKQLKKEMTSRTRKAKVLTEDFVVMEDDSDESNDEDSFVATSKQHKKNIMKRNRTKRFKKAKTKRMEKEKRIHGV